jgi:hypothetical protein
VFDDDGSGANGDDKHFCHCPDLILHSKLTLGKRPGSGCRVDSDIGINPRVSFEAHFVHDTSSTDVVFVLD